MTDTELESTDYGGAKRRTWTNIFVSTTYITTGFIFLIILAVGSYFMLGEIPS